MEQQLDGETGDGPGRLRPAVVELLDVAPGPDLVANLLVLAGWDDLSARELVEVAVGWSKASAFCAAGELAVVADLDRALPTAPRRGKSRVPAGRRAADELAPALGISPGTASALVNHARRVDAELPAAHDALASGRMSAGQLRVLDEVTRGQSPEVTRRVEAVAVQKAPRCTPSTLRAELETAAQRANPEFAAEHAAKGRDARDVALRRSPTAGCRRLVMDLPRTDAEAAWLAVNGAAAAAKERGDARSFGQLRADAATGLLTGQADPTDPALVPTPERLRARVEVQVVVSADTLRGAGDEPAQIPGSGPVDADHAREVAKGAAWRRLVVYPDTGTLQVRGTKRYEPSDEPRLERVLTDPVEAAPPETTAYRPPKRLREHVHARDGGCIGAACHHPTRGTQLDHTTDHAKGGATSHRNLGSQCQRVHNAKTHGGWQLQQPTPGTFIWTGPTGRRYTRRARPLLPGWRGHEDDEPP
jgi:hypothetical protein